MRCRLRAFRGFKKFRLRLLADPKIKADDGLPQQVRLLRQLDTNRRAAGHGSRTSRKQRQAPSGVVSSASAAGAMRQNI